MIWLKFKVSVSLSIECERGGGLLSLEFESDHLRYFWLSEVYTTRGGNFEKRDWNGVRVYTWFGTEWKWPGGDGSTHPHQNNWKCLTNWLTKRPKNYPYIERQHREVTDTLKVTDKFMLLFKQKERMLLNFCCRTGIQHFDWVNWVRKTPTVNNIRGRALWLALLSS